MWELDTTYQDEMQATFDRLIEKKILLSKARPFPTIVLKRIKEALSIEWIYNSNSIEGNTLTLRETQMVLQEGVTVKGKSLREHFEAKNHEIHPFYEGNGRTVHLAMNLLLMKEGFPPAIILTNDRKKYYDALNKANNGNYSKLMLVMSQALERTLNIYLNALPDSADEYESIVDIVNDPDVPYGQEYVSLLARQGEIDAYKEGRNWLTSKQAILDYIKNK